MEVKNYILIIVEKVVDTMQRKYVYIIAFLLAIIVSVSDYYVELSLNSVNVNELETTNNLEPNIFDENEFLDIFDSAAMKTPLIITNYQNDENHILYKYNLKIEGVYGAHKYQKNDKEGYLVFSANGETTFELNSNESITIFDIPSDVEYYIEQITRDSEKYITKINDVEGYSLTGTVFIETHIDIENNTKPSYVPPVENDSTSDEKDEGTTQVKPNPDEENPVTGDSLYFVIALLGATIILLFSLTKVKVKRFE